MMVDVDSCVRIMKEALNVTVTVDINSTMIRLRVPVSN